MSDVSKGSAAAAGATQHPVTSPISEPTTTAWAGWAFFAGIMMLMLGAFQAIEALTALFNQNYLLVKSSGLVVHVNIAAWGWVHLILGVVAVLAGFAVIAGRMWGRVVGIIMAGVSAIVNLAYIAAYPLWSVIVIALDIIVIHALAVHGREVRRP